MIYLDNSATTALSLQVKQAMLAAMEEYANPSSLHKAGLAAHKILNDARASVALAFGVRNPAPGQIIFTSSGTEASNLAIFGTVGAKKRRISNRIISTDSEHPSIENSLRKLEEQGFEVIRIPTKSGVLDFDAYEEALKVPPILVTMMMVNNETGAAYDVKRAFEMAKSVSPETVTHCDAVQGFMKVRFTPASIKADLVSVSAHKIHGPKGVGALYVDPAILRSKKLVPIIFGGGQENGFRSGTENIVGIAGFGAAAESAYKELSKIIETETGIRAYAEEKIGAIGGIGFNIPKGERAPHILSIVLPDIKSETMLHHLSSCDICVSSGSACSSHSTKTSSALKAFGVSDREADCTLRLSFCEYNTKEEIDALCDALANGVQTLVKIRK